MSAVATEPMTATALLAMLRRHYLPESKAPGGLFIPEIGSPDDRRRADLLWIPTTIAEGRGRRIIGHELKVSRADLLRELAEPAKADPWARYCSAWWLVVGDPALLEGRDVHVPEPWGVMAPPSGRRTRSMTIVKPAPELTPEPIEPALRKLMLWLGYRWAEGRTSLVARNLEVAHLQDIIERERRERREAGPLGHDLRRVADIVRRVEQHSRTSRSWLTVDDDLVVEAIIDYATTRSRAQVIRNNTANLVANVRRILEPFHGPALEELERLDEATPANVERIEGGGRQA